jgi:hypothetical protein
MAIYSSLPAVFLYGVIVGMIIAALILLSPKWRGR